MNRTRLMQTSVAAATCAVVAAAIGITTGAAAPSNDSTTKDSSGPRLDVAGPPPDGRMKDGAGPRLDVAVLPAPPALGRKVEAPAIIGGPPLHSEMVVPTRSGENFVTVTQDSGTVKSVSGDQLTITEGTKEATYKTVTLDIPSDARVVRNGRNAELGDLRQGDHVHVSQSPQDSFVFATDSDYMKNAFRRFKHLPPPPDVDGLPPGLPPTGMARPRR
jgi:hypothetical protein